MRAVDTNLLVRLLVRDEPRQLAAAERFIASGAWISHIVIVETMWVLDSVYARTAKQIATAIEMLLSHTSLTLQDPEVVAAALDCYRKHRGVGFSDCLVLETARQAGHVPLGTFDNRLMKLEGAQRP